MTFRSPSEYIILHFTSYPDLVYLSSFYIRVMSGRDICTMSSGPASHVRIFSSGLRLAAPRGAEIGGKPATPVGQPRKCCPGSSTFVHLVVNESQVVASSGEASATWATLASPKN